MARLRGYSRAARGAIVYRMARIAIIADDMFEDSELRQPYDRLREAGHEVVVVGLEAGKQIAGKRGKERLTVERAVEDARADEFDALVIPGGYSPDKLRTSRPMVAFTRAFFDQGKLVAAVCHAPSMLVEADVAEGRTVTSWPSIRTDLINAGARWVDREVVEDGNLITSRKPDDLPAFSRTILRRLEERAAERAGRPAAGASPDMQAP
jgi:protease I